METENNKKSGRTVYYFINDDGVEIGSANFYKIREMADRDVRDKSRLEFKKCDRDDFRGEYHNEEWMGR